MSASSPMEHILSVAELTRNLAQVVERAFNWVWVQGEVTDLSRPSSGHMYFSLKGGGCLIKCVWFKNSQGRGAFDPLTGEVFEGPGLAQTLDNGQEIMVAGRVRVYGARGVYQLVVDVVQSVGEGALAQEFEKLKQRLGQLGYFAQERKRPLPDEPQKVAVVTALAGAALRDFLRIGQSRGLGGTLRIYPSLVQGTGAAREIAAAIKAAEQWAQVVVLIRGGGSLQDLWAFNEEEVARAVYECRVPVLSGIGHQVDHSIADFTADVAAATPSHAAQLLWPEREAYVQTVDELELELGAVMKRSLRRATEQWQGLERALAWLSPARRLEERRQGLEAAHLRLQRAMAGRLEQEARAVDQAVNGLQRWGLGLEGLKTLLANLEERLRAGARLDMLRRDGELAELSASLRGLDPAAPLGRGYAMLRDARGNFIRSVRQIRPGHAVSIRLGDGEALSRIEKIKEIKEKE